MAGAQPAGLRQSNQFVLQRERRYHPGYYAAFVLDPDGNNIKAVYHGPSPRSAPDVVVTPA